MRHWTKQVVVIGLGMLMVILLVGCGVPRATTPAEVMDRVRVGMTYSEVKDVVDLDYFEHIEWVDFAKLEVIGDTVYYEAIEMPDYPNISDYETLEEYGEALDEYDKAFMEFLKPSPYWGWLLFDDNGQSPAFIGFERDEESTVIVVTRI